MRPIPKLAIGIPPSEAVSGESLGKIGRDPSVSKSNWLQVDIFQVFFNDLKVYCKHSSETNIDLT